MNQTSQNWQNLVSTHVANGTKPLIVLLGPTTSGKTDLSLSVAEFINASEEGIRAEIVNADSRQLYRFLDIGTAKILPLERRGIPHHLLDVLDPHEPVTIAWYKEQAMKAIDAIHERGHIPLLVGGSMLYVSAVIDGLEPLPASDPALRARLESAYDDDGGTKLHQRLSEIDPEAAASIPVQNKVYLIRALELYELTGQPASTLKKTSACPYDVLILGITRPPEELKERINRRTKQMLEHGWIEEVHSLLESGYTELDPGLESHGYREILAALQSGQIDKTRLAEEISAKTRQYAKRQMTWWRGDPRIHWITPPAGS